MGDTQRHKDLRMDGILLIEKAFMIFEDAKTHYENYDSNPNIVDKEICSFLLQRAIEDIIKGFLNYYYTDYLLRKQFGQWVVLFHLRESFY